jgi:hypothetical protein
MRISRTTLLRGIIMIAIAINCGNRGMAQNESGKRPLNRSAFEEQKGWYDATTAMYQVKYPIIRSLPPLSSGMPWDILGSYIYLDSIVRFDNHEQTVASLASWSTMNDTLKGLSKYFYKTMDYNPILLTQYTYEVDLKRGRRYVASVNSIIGELFAAFHRSIPNRAEAPALCSTFFPDYILRVRINAIDSMPLKPWPSRSDSHIFRVTASVLDTLKGRVFSTCTDQYSTGSGGSITAALNPPCIQFGYVHGNYFRTDGLLETPWMYPARDEAFFASPSDNGFAMHPGQEAIVFLSHHGRLLDSSFDYFSLNLDPTAAYNALPIINGQVRDINHIWSGSESIDYADWKARFITLRDKILNGTY